MDTICENCWHFNDTDMFCEELDEIVHELQSCNQFCPKSPCCGEEVNEDYMICPRCKEHC